MGSAGVRGPGSSAEAGTRGPWLNFGVSGGARPGAQRGGPAFRVSGGARPGRGGRLLLEVSWTEGKKEEQRRAKSLEVSWTEGKKEEQHPGAAHWDTAVLGR